MRCTLSDLSTVSLLTVESVHDAMWLLQTLLNIVQCSFSAMLDTDEKFICNK